MKAIFKKRPEPGFVLGDAPEPKIGPHEVLIQVRAGSVCGTDAHIYHWDAWARNRIRPPLIIGHEFAGTVAEVGSEVSNVRPGDTVSAEGHIVCGACRLCRTGQAHICRDCRIIGVDRDGAFAERIAMPAGNVWKIDYDISIEVAAMHDALGNAFHATLVAPVSGKTVLVQGCGPIGLFCVGIAKASGASWIAATDLNPFRLELARKMGAHRTIDPNREDPAEIIRKETDRLGVDVVLEMSGNPKAIRQGFQVVTNGGSVSLLGIPSDEITLDLARDVIFKGITVHGIIGRKMYETWHQIRAFLSSGLFDPRPVITDRIPYTEYDAGMQAIKNGSAGKVVLLF
jgi:threonine 3-dehydrogenase